MKARSLSSSGSPDAASSAVRLRTTTANSIIDARALGSAAWKPAISLAQASTTFLALSSARLLSMPKRSPMSNSPRDVAVSP